MSLTAVLRGHDFTCAGGPGPCLQLTVRHQIACSDQAGSQAVTIEGSGVFYFAFLREEIFENKPALPSPANTLFSASAI